MLGCRITRPFGAGNGRGASEARSCRSTFWKRELSVGFFKPKPLPPTSYGYSPPPGATTHGWVCTNRDCGRSDHEAVRRWPKPCPHCGAATDPLFDEPWAHEAQGVELQWFIRNDPERGGGFHQTQWEVWQLKDALLRGDQSRASQARARGRAYAQKRHEEDRRWGPGHMLFHFVWYDLEARDLDAAADDLLFWASLSSTEDVENDNTNRTNSRQFVDMTSRFLANGGARHPQAPAVKQACLRIAEAAFQILNGEQQNAVRQMARS